MTEIVEVVPMENIDLSDLIDGDNDENNDENGTTAVVYCSIISSNNLEWLLETIMKVKLLMCNISNNLFIIT